MSNTISVNVVADVKNISRGIKEVNGHLDGFGSSISKATGMLKGLAISAVAMAGVTGVADFLKGSVEAARASNAQMAMVEAHIKSTGAVAGISAKHVEELANKTSMLTGVTKDTVVTQEQLALTFTNIRNRAGSMNDIFDRSILSAENIAKSLGTDVPHATIMLSKALNDPIKGIVALGKAGITFSEQEKEQIKNLMKHNDVLGAQKVVLGEVDKQTAGSAAAAATASDKWKAAVSIMKEKIGNVLIPILDKIATYLTVNLPEWIKKGGEQFTKFKEYIKPLTDWITSTAAPAIRDFIKGFADDKGDGGKLRDLMGNLLTVIKDVSKFVLDHKDIFGPLAISIFATVESIKAVIAITKAWTAAQVLLDAALDANPIGLVVIAIGALVGAIAWMIQDAGSAGKAWETFCRGLDKIAGWVVGVVVTGFKWMFDQVTGFIGNILSKTATVAEALHLPFASGLRKTSDEFNAWIKRSDDSMSGLAKDAGTWGSQVGKNLGAGISSQGQQLNAMSAKVAGDVKYSLNINAYPIGQNVNSGLAKGISDDAQGAINAANLLGGRVAKALRLSLQIQSPSRVAMEIGRFVGMGLIQGMDSMGGKVADSASNMASAVAKGFTAPKLALNADFGSNNNANAAANNTYQITVQAVAPNAEVGRAVVKAIDAYQSLNGVPL